MNGLLKFLKTAIISGLLFLVPVVLLILVLEKAFKLVRDFLRPLVSRFSDSPLLGIPGITIAAVLSLVLIFLIAGLVARTSRAKRFREWIETQILSRIPGYSIYSRAVGGMTKSMSSLESQSATNAVLVRVDDDAWQIGLVTDTLDNGNLIVFVPDAPSPISGSLFIFPKDRVKDSGLSITEAGHLLRCIGVGSGKKLSGKFGNNVRGDFAAPFPIKGGGGN